MKKTIILVGIMSLFLSVNIFAQMPLIRESNKQEIAQTIGDSRVSIVYHRPNTKGRKNIFGCQSTDVIPVGGKEYPCLVPNGQVWRTGANDNTTIEFATDVSINGQPLPAGKYAFFAIPEKNEWTLIFNKVNNEWGSYTYKAAQDALRVKTMPMKSKTSQDTLMYEFESISGNSSKVVLSWEKMQVPFTVSVGDVMGRAMVKIREAVANAKADDMRTLNQAAGFVINNKISGSYEEAMGWLNKSIAIRETYGNLSAKARLYGEMGKTADAIATGEKAVMVGKAASPAVDTANFEKTITGWKTKK
jgi:hypothetical protein